jgi:adenine-specific DNA-methyltransferase
MENFTDFTKEISSQLNKIEKKQHGVFFTPKTYRDQIFRLLDGLILQPKTILEPSFGSGEFLKDALDAYPKSAIHGVELNTLMFEKVKEKYRIHSNMLLFNHDFIDFTIENRYDLIIGNPPYVVVKGDDKRTKYFKEISCGRPNLYCWFIFKCINMLDLGGILAFIIPNSIMNTSYYDPLRKFIVKNCEILNIIEFHKQKTDFQDTEQATIGLILRKIGNVEKEKLERRFIVEHKSRLFFNTNFEQLQRELNTHPSLSDLGFGVRTGTIVWNQHKDNMVGRNELCNYDDSRPLIYTTNLKKGRFVEFVCKNGKEQFFSQKKGKRKSVKLLFKAPVILMNRGYGNTLYNPEMLFINTDVLEYDEFYVENHLNVIFPLNDLAKKNIDKVYEYLKSDKNKKFIEMYCGNGAFSKTEIETILPICLE